MRNLLPAGAAILLGLTAQSICAARTKEAPLPPHAQYVALGSSYAAGAGIGPNVPGSPGRCWRSANNYAHLVAAKLGLDLIDASCSGATTAHVLGPWLELPAQLSALTAETRLVTVTIGGNDVNYVGNLMAAACRNAVPARTCPAARPPGEADFQRLEANLRLIAREVHQRAPRAKLVFVDYLRIVPEAGGCTAVPIGDADASAARETFRRLAAATRSAARAEGAMLLEAGALSAGHDACSPEPWAAGHPGHPADWHPTAAGHAAIAAALIARLPGQ